MTDHYKNYKPAIILASITMIASGLVTIISYCQDQRQHKEEEEYVVATEIKAMIENTGSDSGINDEGSYDEELINDGDTS